MTTTEISKHQYQSQAQRQRNLVIFKKKDLVRVHLRRMISVVSFSKKGT